MYISDELAGLYGEYLWRLCDQGAADGPEPLESGWAFVNLRRQPHVRMFSPMQAHTVYAKVSTIKRNQGGRVPAEFTPHWFRHTHASTLLLAGVDLHVVMRRLGHLDAQTTLDTYGWVTRTLSWPCSRTGGPRPIGGVSLRHPRETADASTSRRPSGVGADRDPTLRS